MYNIKPFDIENDTLKELPNIRASNVEELYTLSEGIEYATIMFGDQTAGNILNGDVAWTAEHFNTHPEVSEAFFSREDSQW